MGPSHAGQRRLGVPAAPGHRPFLSREAPPGWLLQAGRAGGRTAGGVRKAAEQRLFPSRGQPGWEQGFPPRCWHSAPPAALSEAGVKGCPPGRAGAPLPARVASPAASLGQPSCRLPPRRFGSAWAVGRGMRCSLQEVSGRPRVSAVKLQTFVLTKLHTRLGASSVCTSQTSKVFLADVFQSHEEDDRKVRRREKNRVAAQRSRKKQTQKADKLHEVNGYLVLCSHGLGTEHGTLQ